MTLEELLVMALPELEQLAQLVAQAIAQKKSAQQVAVSGEVLGIDAATDALEDKTFPRGES